MQDQKMEDHFTGLENAGPEKGRIKKKVGGNWRTTVAHIIKQNTRVPDAKKLQLIQLGWEKQREKALKVTMDISRKRVSS